MGQHKLELLEEGNPEYYKLINESNEIISEYNRIMNLVHSFKLHKIKLWKCELPKPSFFYCRAKADLSIIGREGMSLRDRFINWNDRALKFCQSPHYRFSTDPEVDKQTSVILFTNLLLHRADRLNSDITLLQSNYNLRFSEIENAINFWIAITAWLITFVGLLVSII